MVNWQTCVKPGQGLYSKGKHDGTETTGRDRTGTAAKIAPAGTSANGTAADIESKTAPAGTVANGAGSTAETKTAPTGAVAIGAGAGRETKIASAGRAEETVKAVPQQRRW
jgi:hypothetical protein